MQRINKTLYLSLYILSLSPSFLYAMDPSSSNLTEEDANLTKKAAQLKIAPPQKYDEGYDSEEDKSWEYEDPLENLSQALPKNQGILIPFFRGIHFFSDKFNSQSRGKFLRQTQINQPIFSPAIFKEVKIACSDVDDKGFLLQNPKSKKHQEALAKAGIVKANIKALNDDQKTDIMGSRTNQLSVNKYTFLHYLYINKYDKFIEKLAAEPKLGFLDNPFVSVAETPKHPLNYAFGLKFNQDRALRPQFDKKGKPTYPYLGKFYVILAPFNNINNELFRNIESYAKGEIIIGARIKHEVEAIFPAFIPGEYVVSEHIIRVPNFQHKWKAQHLFKYGLTKEIYKNQRKAILDMEGKCESPKEAYETLATIIVNNLFHKFNNLPISRSTIKFLNFDRSLSNSSVTVEQSHRLEPYTRRIPFQAAQELGEGESSQHP